MTTDDEILTLNAVYSGVITLENAAERLRITEDEVNAMLEGYFWVTESYNAPTDTDYICNDTMNPKVFESLFLEYIKLTNTGKISETLKNKITTHLNEMLSAFPFETFPELHGTHFDWDNATRFLLGNIQEASTIDMLKKLRDEFWNIYSYRMRVIRDVTTMKSKYYGALKITDKKIEDIKNEILEIYDIPVEESMRSTMRLMYDTLNTP